MITGIGYSKRYPDIRAQGYVTWALAQTPPDHVSETAASLDRTYAHLGKSGLHPYGDRLSPFQETAALDMLGVGATELESRVKGNAAPDKTGSRVLLFANHKRGNDYTSFGDILGSAGYAVTVASADTDKKQDQWQAKPNIIYLRRSMGELNENDAAPGFKLALLSQGSGLISRNDYFKDGKITEVFTPEEKLRGALRMLQPLGRLVVTETADVRGLTNLLDNDPELSEEVSELYDRAYLHTYTINPANGLPSPTAPSLIFERHAQ